MQLVIRNNENKLQLNEKVLEIIDNSTNPEFYLFYGKTRLGKSTTLNQLIRGNQETWKYKNRKPFEAVDSLNSITKGCIIYGPIKASELLKRHNINKNKKFEDFDIFFCDTEGISSLDGIQKETIPGILTLLQISTISVFMVQKHCDMNNLKEICSQIQISRCLKQINGRNSNKNKEFPTPKIAVYISNIFTNLEKDKNEEEEDEIEEDFRLMKNKYNESSEAEKLRIYKAVEEKYPNLDLQLKDFDVIPGGPYDNNCNKEPDHEDINAQLYWWSINKLMEKFFAINRKKMNSKEIINMIKFLFELFQYVDSLNIDDFNLEEFLKKYLTQKFENYSKKKFNEKLDKIKNDIKTNFLQYLEIINDVEKAKKSLNECFDENIELYKKLIRDKVESFIDLHIELYQKKIKEQIDKEFKSICEYILSEENIDILIKDVIDLINKAEFKEDINMNKVTNLEVFWNTMYEQNKIILDYFKEKKADILNNLKQNFLFKINQIFQNLLKKKIEWSTYSKNNIINIQNEINKIYFDALNKCNYQEDFEMIVKKPENLYNEIFPSFVEKYFQNISNNRLNEIKEKVINIIKKEYENIKKNKLPIWKDIKSDLISRIKEVIKLYITKIFYGKKFRDEIDPNLGRKDVFYNVIPLNIKENSFNKKEKGKEINDLIEKELESAVIYFNKLREKLPLFKECMGNIINQCTQIINLKMNELLQQFYYLEEKKVFNSDIIYALLAKNENIFKNSGSKFSDLNIKLRELCDMKAKEYDLLVKRNKPEWNKIKSEKKLIINEKCLNFQKKLFENAEFQDDIKSINYENLKKSIIEMHGFFNGVASHKEKELNLLIDEIIQRTIEKIYSKKNTLKNWESIKYQKVQEAYIEMLNKSKGNLKSLDINKVTKILIEHIEMIPKFFDCCKDSEKRKELLNEITIIANIISEDYIQRKNEEIRKKKEEEERKKKEEERKKKEEEERKKKEEEERKKKEEEERRKREEGERNRIEALARRVIKLEFGVGEERKRLLGKDYPRVQNRVNEILGFSKRYPV